MNKKVTIAMLFALAVSFASTQTDSFKDVLAGIDEIRQHKSRPAQEKPNLTMEEKATIVLAHDTAIKLGRGGKPSNMSEILFSFNHTISDPIKSGVSFKDIPQGE